MGYYVHQSDSEFRMDRDKAGDALSAIKAIPFDTSSMVGSGGWSWVSDYREAGSLVAAMQDWRWELHLTDELDIVGLEFTGEKAGDDEVVFRAIAPYVDSGSYVEMTGEEDEVWRYWFIDGRLEVEYAVKIEFWSDSFDRQLGGLIAEYQDASPFLRSLWAAAGPEIEEMIREELAR